MSSDHRLQNLLSLEAQHLPQTLLEDSMDYKIKAFDATYRLKEYTKTSIVLVKKFTSMVKSLLIASKQLELYLDRFLLVQK